MTEDEMAGWHHQLDGHEFGPDTPGSPEGNTEPKGSQASSGVWRVDSGLLSRSCRKRSP